jgi:AcrR family transcriptional regulator
VRDPHPQGDVAPVGAKRKRRSTEEVVDRLIRAAGEEFERSGYAGATTASIARRAEVTEAQLFRCFGSKAQLFSAAVFTPLNQHFQEFNSAHAADLPDGEPIRERIVLYISELQAFIGEHSKLLMSLAAAQAHGPSDARGVGEVDGLDAYFERGAAMMAARMQEQPKVDPRLMVRAAFAAVLAAVMFQDWIFPAGLAGEDEIRSAVVNFVIDGINANADPSRPS